MGNVNCKLNCFKNTQLVDDTLEPPPNNNGQQVIQDLLRLRPRARSSGNTSPVRVSVDSKSLGSARAGSAFSQHSAILGGSSPRSTLLLDSASSHEGLRVRQSGEDSALIGGLPAELWDNVAFNLRGSATDLESMAKTCRLFAAIAKPHQTVQELIERADRTRTVEDFASILNEPAMRDPNAPAAQDPNATEVQGSVSSTSQQPLPGPLPLPDQELIVERLAVRMFGISGGELLAVRSQLQHVIDHLPRRDELTQQLATNMVRSTLLRAGMAQTPQDILAFLAGPVMQGGSMFSMEDLSKIMERVVATLLTMTPDEQRLAGPEVRRALGQLPDETAQRLNAALDNPDQVAPGFGRIFG